MVRWTKRILALIVLVAALIWSYQLGNWGVGDSLDELQTIGNGIDVAVLTDDPAVSATTELTVIPPDGWQLRVRPIGPATKDAVVRRGKMLIVIAGGLTIAPHATQELRKAGYPVRNYAAKSLPWTFAPTPVTTVEVPYAGSFTGGYQTDLNYLIGDLPELLVARTATGVDMAAPSVGQPYLHCAGSSVDFCGVSADLGTVVRSERSWHGHEQLGSEKPTASIEALVSGNWSIASSNPPPTKQSTSWVWQSWPSVLSRPVIRFSSTDQQRRSERDLLWSGIIFGIVGGVLATWLTNIWNSTSSTPPRQEQISGPPPPVHPPQPPLAAPPRRHRILRFVFLSAVGALAVAHLLDHSRRNRRDTSPDQ